MITIKLKNAGPIEAAEFDIGGLTVMAGLNATGKTFISKTIFSIIKTVKDAEQYLKRSQEEEMEELTERLDTLIRRSIEREGATEALTWNLKKNTRFSIGDKNSAETLNKIKQICLSAQDQALSEHKEKFSQLLGSINSFEKELEVNEPQENYKRCFNSFINNTFKKNFNNLFSGKISTIEIINDKEQELMKFSVEGNKVTNLNVFSNSPLKLIEVNYLFSPVALQFFKFISLTSSRRYLGLSSFGTSYKNEYEISKSLGAIIADLFSKLLASAATPYAVEGEFQTFLKKIKNLTGGYLEYDDKERDFVFRFEQNGKEASVPVSNTAEGIKAFGILQLLLGVEGLIAPDSLLLFDEPEVHLHPEWQIELAKLLVKLAEIGIPIFISSHSPYMLEALYTYANRSFIKENFRLYYLEKQGENGSVLKNLTKEDPFPVFEKMSEAMDEINNEVND